MNNPTLGKVGRARQDRDTFDQAGFAAAVAATIRRRGVSDRQAASEADVAPSTVIRCIRGTRCPDVHSLCALARWAGVSVDDYVRGHNPVPGRSRADVLAQVDALGDQVDELRITVVSLHQGGPS